ncbi:MAG: SDR family oxidoreductase [Furfurilactobacillus sp.]|uniref:SDR family oxidoreductase n=1 Tax=Furfurilactobacillus milii TaxID=2888272 RepID=A0ABT6DD44_9LACO|nr:MULTISPECIES: NAD(P)-binding oxidoreductase [Furfurilactobacillus]QLE65779.1 NAD-dependent dehydratase [Furfurilactobacillus rossiae]MCF6160309.1 SDR family oxidoreductase [Furfurilactobacillus milii]MCF6162252.1 SDR family oxidoreductase [Furfurilactobacillus milii]MCH4012303.1 SDR family oxidoreductase [Furfurilactobacillus sp.]MCH4038195.1 SDR family oxidoreductase [Furfurilactobacillus sp.]
MQITIFGATGSVGHYLINEAQRRGDTVVAVSRHAHSKQSSGVSWQSVDYDSLDSIVKTLAGSDAAIISLGDYDVITPTQNIVAAMKVANLKRVEILTGFGTSSASRKQLGIGMRAVMTVMMPMLRTKEKQDQIIRNSGLIFTIVQPPTLTDGPATHAYRYGNYGHKSISGHIARADLAEFMITNLVEDRFKRESVYLQN